jgi:hypothetical protein
MSAAKKPRKSAGKAVRVQESASKGKRSARKTEAPHRRSTAKKSNKTKASTKNAKSALAPANRGAAKKTEASKANAKSALAKGGVTRKNAKAASAPSRAAKAGGHLSMAQGSEEQPAQGAPVPAVGESAEVKDRSWTAAVTATEPPPPLPVPLASFTI